MLVDANILLFAVDEEAHLHESAKDWLATTLNGSRRVALPWTVLGAFVRVITNPRVSPRSLLPQRAWTHVEGWLAADTVWIPSPTERHAHILGSLITTHQLRGNLITDAQLAALAIEHGLTVYSADTDFARFKEIRWVNPLV